MKHTVFISLLLGTGLMFSAPEADACTRVLYQGDNGEVITGRSLDWKEEIPTNLYVLPQGIARRSYDTDSCLTWVSQYGSVVAVGYDMGVTEGMNQEGLVCNLLYLPGSTYTYPGDRRLYMSSSLWAQWVLDNFATVNEAVRAISRDLFRIDAPKMPGGSETTLHMAISDITGNSCIVEYIDGKLSLHVGHEYTVLTNAPPYDRQLVIRDYWQKVGGMNMLPGTNRAEDRFTRASFYLSAIPRDARHDLALAGVFGILFNCSVPVGMHVEGSPELSATRWRSVADQKNAVYYFATLLNPSVMWIDLNDFLLSPGAPVMKLDMMQQKKAYLGNVVKDMKRSKAYTPLFRYQ